VATVFLCGLKDRFSVAFWRDSEGKLKTLSASQLGRKVRLLDSFQHVETINGCSQNFELPLTVRRLFHFFRALPSVSSPNLCSPICTPGHRDAADSRVLAWQKGYFL
jgi:hypothetical protein